MRDRRTPLLASLGHSLSLSLSLSLLDPRKESDDGGEL